MTSARLIRALPNSPSLFGARESTLGTTRRCGVLRLPGHRVPSTTTKTRRLAHWFPGPDKNDSPPRRRRSGGAPRPEFVQAPKAWLSLRPLRGSNRLDSPQTETRVSGAGRLVGGERPAARPILLRRKISRTPAQIQTVSNATCVLEEVRRRHTYGRRRLRKARIGLRRWMERHDIGARKRFDSDGSPGALRAVSFCPLCGGAPAGTPSRSSRRRAPRRVQREGFGRPGPVV